MGDSFPQDTVEITRHALVLHSKLLRHKAKLHRRLADLAEELANHILLMPAEDEGHG